jgi:hypothetical protein
MRTNRVVGDQPLREGGVNFFQVLTHLTEVQPFLPYGTIEPLQSGVVLGRFHPGAVLGDVQALAQLAEVLGVL